MTRGGEIGPFVRSSKNGFGRPSPRAPQPSTFAARSAKMPSEARGGTFAGSGLLVVIAIQHRR
jgi:hypothetical protein